MFGAGRQGFGGGGGSGDYYNEYQIWNAVSEGTTGTVSVPKEGGGEIDPSKYTVQTGQYPYGYDAIAWQMEDGKITTELALDTEGEVLQIDLSGDDNRTWTVADGATPAAYPFAISFIVVAKIEDFKDVDWDYVIGTPAPVILFPNVVQRSGVAIKYDTDTQYNTNLSTGTGDITADLTDARLGATSMLFHSGGSEPSYPATWTRLSGSQNYNTSSTWNLIVSIYHSDTFQTYYIVPADYVLLDHLTDLQNVGTLTHAEIDTFISTTAPATYLKLDQTTPQTVANGFPYFSTGINAPKIKANADSTTAIQFVKADGSTAVVNIDTTNSRVGLGGNTTPDTQLQMTNDNWFSAKDFAGTSYVNLLKVNTSDEIDVGGTMNISGSIEAPTNAGAITLFNMPVTSAAADNTEESATIKLGGSNVLKFYSQSDGAGAVDNIRAILYGDFCTATGKYFYLGNTSPTADTENDIRAYNNGGTWVIQRCSVANAVKGAGTWVVENLQRFVLKIDSDLTPLVTGDGKLYFPIPQWLNGWNLYSANAFVTTVSSSGAITIMINNATDGADMLSTAITIEEGETTSYDATTPSVVDPDHDDVVTADMIRVDCDDDGTGALGFGIYLEFVKP